MGTVESEVVARIEKPKEEPIATAINPKLPVSENLDELPNLYILAVGVSEFQHESIQDLQFADVDAVEFEETWRRQEGVRFHRIHSRVLINEAATKREIERGLGWIEKEATSNDTVDKWRTS